jgi:hypothetical protein
MGFNEEQARAAKLGRVTTPGGVLGENVEQDIAVTVGKLGPLPDGQYTLEATVKCYVLQCDKAYADTNPSAATVKAEGVIVPAGAEVTFNVDAPIGDAAKGDGYLLWVRDTVDGKLRINDRTTARRG